MIVAFTDKKRATAYVESYKAEHYERLKLQLRKGHKEIVKTAADAVGESMNVYIKEAIASRLVSEGHFVPPDF